MNIHKNRFYFLIWLLFICLTEGCHRQATHPSYKRPLPVSVTEVKQEDIPVYIEAIGNIKAFNQVDLRPQVGGKVTHVYIQGGQDVKAGEILYLIDPIPYQLVLEKAKATLLKNEAQLEYAKQRLERHQKLIQNDFVSKLNIEEFDSHVKALEGQVLMDRADADLAQINLDYCAVSSPIEGRICLNRIDPGNLVTANDSIALTKILQITPVYVYFSIPQKEFQEVQKVLETGDRKFTVILPFDDQREFDGEAISLDNQVNMQTGTIQLRGIVQNEEKILWPGEFVRVRLYIKKKEQVPVIPSAALQIGQKGTFVYVLHSDMTVEAVNVKATQHVGDLVAIDEGLKPGMKVVIDGQVNLYSGAQVILPPSSEDLQGATKK